MEMWVAMHMLFCSTYEQVWVSGVRETHWEEAHLVQCPQLFHQELRRTVEVEISLL